MGVIVIWVNLVVFCFNFGVIWFCVMVGFGFVVDVIFFEDCVVLICGVIKYLEDKVGVFDVFCVFSFWEKDFIVCCDGIWDIFFIMCWGFFVIGVIIVLMFCMEKGKLEVVEMGIFEVEVEIVVLIDEVIGVVIVFIVDFVGFIVVEVCVYISIGI